MRVEDLQTVHSDTATPINCYLKFEVDLLLAEMKSKNCSNCDNLRGAFDVFSGADCKFATYEALSPTHYCNKHRDII